MHILKKSRIFVAESPTSGFRGWEVSPLGKPMFAPRPLNCLLILVDPFALKYDVKINNAIAKIAIKIDADKNKWLQSILIKTQKQIFESLTKCPSTNS